MAVATYTKSGAKATAPAKLDKAVFGLKVENHQLLKEAYLAYLANGRTSNAVTKRRGEVRGGGRKPWRQKGTGNARVGSSRTPLWRGGGIIFGPTGEQDFSRKLNANAKKLALRQALSLAATENRIKVIDSFAVTDGKTKSAAKLLSKIQADGNTLLVVAAHDNKTVQATGNLTGLKLTSANYLNVYDVLNADCLILEKAALEVLDERLQGAKQ